jgi:dipeptidyl aminopeptidase/acylaminoacyl peptidase
MGKMNLDMPVLVLLATVLLCPRRTDADELRFVGEKAACRCSVVAVDDKTVELRVAGKEVTHFRIGDDRSAPFPDRLRLEGHRRDRQARILAWEKGILVLRVSRRDVSQVTMARSATKKPSDTQARLGNATGEVRVRGKPAGGVTVRAVRIAVSTFLGERRTTQEKSYVARTDKHGVFRFEKLPPGSYKIYVQLKPEDGWIRRLRDKPDFVVKAGERTKIPAVRIPTRVY